MIIPLLVTFFFLILLITGFVNKQKNSISDFLYSGRKLTTPALVATLVTTWYGGINEIGIEVIHNGVVVWLYFGFFYYIAALLYCYIIAPKIIAKNYSVNTTLGLSFIRTSPDHGTGFEIFGKGTAQYQSMLEAIKTARELQLKSRLLDSH